jgi:hypothetical protein
MNKKEDPNKELSRAVQDQDPRVMLSRCTFPSPEQHQERVVEPLKRGKVLSEREMALQISLWIDTESLG